MAEEIKTTYVYILQCKDLSYYTGITNNPQRRFKEHSAGGARAARYTRAHGVLRFCCCWEAESHRAAAKLEVEIKKLRRWQKEDLISHPEKLGITYAVSLGDLRYLYHKELPSKVPVPSQETVSSLGTQYISEIILDKPLTKDSYLQELPMVQFLQEQNSLTFHHNVTFLVGENGSGKSTLLEAIAVASGFNAEGGTKNFNFSTRSTHSELWGALTLVKRGFPQDGFFLRAESFYNAASYLDDLEKISVGAVQSYGGTSLHRQSHGESFLSLAKYRFGGKGLYLLDEPEAALSPTGQIRLMAEIDRLVKNDSQFIIATHSPILMTFPEAQIYELSDRGIASVDYQDTEHYQLTRRFLENPQKMLQYLLHK